MLFSGNFIFKKAFSQLVTCFDLLPQRFIATKALFSLSNALFYVIFLFQNVVKNNNLFYYKVCLQVKCLQLAALWETNFRPCLPHIKGQQRLMQGKSI